MNKEEALAELARRGTWGESQNFQEEESPSTQRRDALEYTEGDPFDPRDMTWGEFSQLFPFHGSPGKIPKNAAPTPDQSALLGISGGIDATGFGIQQALAKALGFEKYGKQVDQEAEAKRRLLERSREANPISTFSGELGGGVASSLPFMGAAASAPMNPYIANILGDVGWGASQYTTEDESGILNALLAGAGAAISPVISGAGKVLTGALKSGTGRPATGIATDVLESKNMSPRQRENTLTTAERRTIAANELNPDLVLTPGEATGSPSIASNQAALGKSEKGNMQMEEFWKKRGQQENKIVEDVFEEMGHNPGQSTADSSRKVREAAKSIAEKQVAARKALSEPLYQGSKDDVVPVAISNQLLKDLNIRQAAINLRKEVPFREAAKGMKKNSIATWDLIKRNLDSQIDRATDKNTKRLLTESKNKLVEMLDNVSPTYKKARNIFSSESSVVDEIMKSDLGKIAKLEDNQLKNVSKILFDPAQVDPKVLQQIRRRLLDENPQIFHDALAKHMQDQISTQAAHATNRKLPAFYKAVLADDKKYNMYMDALRDNPKAQEMLKAMRTAFKDISGDFTPKSAAALEKTSMTTTRNAFAHIWNMLSKGGKYDEAAIKFITDPEWLKKADRILKMKDGYTKSLMIGNMVKDAATKMTEKTGTRLSERKLPPLDDEESNED